MQQNIQTNIRQQQPSNTTTQKHKQKQIHKINLKQQNQIMQQKRIQPIIQLNGGRNTNQNGTTTKIRTGIQINTNNKHMMCPNKKTQQTNGIKGINHRQQTKHKTTIIQIYQM